ncbi:MAG TPA: AsmA family protein [Candidatus Angelobacter sp.]|nr:AsmA family protein [Candidatus Angelobacter sp.]
MALLSRRKIIVAALIVLALAIFLPPNINGSRFSKRLASALSAALGRPVKIGAVSFRLLPRPGFDLYDFEVMDDPAFSAEPLLLCGEVTADLRLTSLWQGRLEIANLKLKSATDKMPPSLNLVRAQGHWNVESLLVRAEQIPTAPTARKLAENRSRFPYIEADAGRINVKIGPEKKPYALANTDFAFWLAAEDQWHFRLEGLPVRSDMSLTDTGTIKVEGDLRRSQTLEQMPATLQVTWHNAQLGELSSFMFGQDRGWRGNMDLTAQLAGPLSALHLTAEGSLQNLRRFDIGRNDVLNLDTRCQGDFNHGLLNFKCNLPVEPGAVRVSGRLSPGSPQNYDLDLVANRVPLSSVATVLRHAKRTLPDDLTATGEMDAAFSFHAHEGGARDWHGVGMTSAFILHSSAAGKPIQVSPIRFHLGDLEIKDAASAARDSARKEALKTDSSAQGSPLIVDPFSVELGAIAPATVQATLKRTDYIFQAKGTAPLERLMELGKITGFPSGLTNTTGTASFELSMKGPWANFAPAHLSGTVHLRNVNAAIAGLKNYLLLSSAEGQLTDSSLVLNHITAEFERTSVAFTGSITSPLGCSVPAQCPLQFDLQAKSLNPSDLAALFGSPEKKWNLPFVSEGDKLPDFHATGTISSDTLTLAEVPVEKFVAHAEIADHALTLSHIGGKVGNGSLQSNWRVDWSSSPVRYSGSGAVTGISLDHVALPDSSSATLASWMTATGKTNLSYSVVFSGQSAAEMLASSSGQAEFLAANGLSRVLTQDPLKPSHFQALQGNLELNHGTLKLLTGKFKAENRIYQMSGTISLADNQANLTVNGAATQWHITGRLDKPMVANPPKTAEAGAVQETSAHIR